MKKAKQYLAFMMAFLMVYSCLNISPMSVEAASKVKLSKKGAKIVIGGKKSIKVKNAKRAKISYKSSKKSVVKVSKKGKVTGIKAGSAKIIVRVKKNGKTTKLAYKVKVKKPSLQGATINRGAAKTLRIANKPKKGAKAKYTWSSSNKAVATVNKKGVVRAVKPGTTTIKVTISSRRKFKYTLSAKVKVVGDTTPYTRGEWVHDLSTRLSINDSGDIDKNDYYFGDTIDDQYGQEAETAQAYELLPKSDNEGYEDPEQDIPLFESDKEVTREYANYTIVKALGFIEDEGLTPDCYDASELQYPIQDAIGINQEIINLDDGYFDPYGFVTKDDGSEMLDKMESIIKSAEVNVSEPIDEVSYQNGVVSDDQVGTQDYTLTEEGEGFTLRIAKTDATQSLKNGTIFVLPANDTTLADVALKAVSDPVDDGGYLIIRCAKPDLGEAVSDIHFEGEGTPIVDQFVPYEGVKVEYEQSDSNMKLNAVDIKEGGTYNPRGKLKVTFDHAISKSGKLIGEAELSIQSITCKVDASVGLFSGVKFKELTLSQTDRLKVTGKVEFTAAEYKEYLTANRDPVSCNKELGRLPIALGTSGLSIDIVLIASYSVKGELSITYTMDLTHGLQVINGSPRIIREFNHSLETLKFKGTAKCGIGIKVVLDAFQLMDLVGFETTLGPAIQVEFIPHVAANLYCGDGRLYMYWDASLSEETALGKFLSSVCHITLEWEIFDEDNSPLKKCVHFENFNLVNKCTYSSGAIDGYVKDSFGNPIANARIKIYRGSILKASVQSNAEGKYKVSDLPEGDYTIKVYVTGCSAFQTTEHVGRNETKYVETLIMLYRNGSNGEGTISGDIINAVTGESISNVKYYIRRNWNNTTGNVVNSGTADGYYNILTIPGNYTIQFKASGFIDTEINIAVSSGDDQYVNVALSPELNLPDDGLIRIVLTWGEVPEDLDSHLTGPMPYNNNRFHIFYEDQNAYDYDNNDNEVLLADLDLDDTSSYGPETVTIHTMTNGTYHYYVHDYTNSGADSSNALSLSNAHVRVYKGKSLLKNYVVPTNIIGTYWHVFDLDKNGNITPVNNMSNDFLDD